MTSRGVLVTKRDGRTVGEVDTLTCVHCNGIHRVTREDPGGFCRQCMKPICSRCAARGTCSPFERRITVLEDRERFRRALGG
jgi:hypothetical protein